MTTKTTFQSKTFWAIVATCIILGGQAMVQAGNLPPTWGPWLANARMLAEALGIWFVRLGIGTPISNGK